MSAHDPLRNERKSLCDVASCPVCGGKGEVYAEAPWARWMTCGRCNGTGSAGVDGDPSRIWGVDDPR